MASTTAAQVVAQTDKMTAIRLVALGTSSSGMGLGTAGSSYGAWKKCDDLEGLVAGTLDIDQALLLGAAYRGMKNASDIRAFIAYAASQALGALSSACAAAGTAGGLGSIADLDTFASYYNLTATTKWGCLFAPDFYDFYASALGRTLTAHNTYYEVLQSGSGNALGKLIIGTGFLSPASIDSTRYAGGFGQIKCVGITGSGTVTVGGTWRKTDGSTATGDGTATVAAGDSTVTLTPAFADALFLGASSIGAAAGVTAGTIYAEAARPTGRTNPPT